MKVSEMINKKESLVSKVLVMVGVVVLSAAGALAQTNAPPAALAGAAVREKGALVQTSTPPAAITITPYGYIKADAVYDSARTAYGDAAFWVLPTTAVGGDKKELTFGARETRLGANIIALEQSGIKATGKVEFDLYEEVATESKYAVRTRLAYLDLAWRDGWSVRAGQDWDAYVNLWPVTVDAAWLGQSGHLYNRRPQVRLDKVTKLGDETRVTTKIGLAQGRAQDVDGDGQEDANASGKPQFQASVGLQTKLLTSKPSTFTLGGVSASETLGGRKANATATPPVTAINEGDYNSTLIIGGAQLPVFEKFTLQGEVWSGKNVDAYLGGIGQGINTSVGTEVAAVGGWVQGVFDLNKQWSASLGYGLDDPKDEDLAGDARTLNSRLFTNVSYKPTSAVTLAVELSKLTTEYVKTADVTDNRVHLAAKYAF